MNQNELEFKVKLALQQFLRDLGTLTTEFDKSMAAVKADGNQTGAALDASFRTLGVKGVKQVEAEIVKLQAALAEIRKSDALPQDKAAAVAAYTARVAELRNQLKPTAAAAREVAAGTESMSAALGNAAHKAVAWTTALAGINSLTDIGKKVIETGSQFQNLQIRLENLLGSTKAAQEAFAMIKNLAATTPFEVTALTESFIKFTAFGMKPTEKQMRALSDVAANLGGGTEMLNRVTIALGQAWAKTKLQGEEILQLAEAGVPVWDALARATGRTVPELQRMSEAGILGRDVISKLIDELGRMNAGASDKLMATYAGAVSNAKDALAEFFDMVSRSGVLDYLTSKVQELLKEFDRMKASGELEVKAKAIADGFLTVAHAVESAIKFMSNYGSVAVKLVEAAIALKAVNAAISFAFKDTAASAQTAATGLKSVGTSTVPAAAGMKAVEATSKAAAAGMTEAAVTTKTAASGMNVAAASATRLATVLRVLRSLTGVGLVLGAVEMATEFFRAKREAEEADRSVKKLLEPSPVNGPKDAAKAAQTAMQQMADTGQRAAADAVAKFDKMRAEGTAVAEAVGKIGKELDTSTTQGVAAAALAFDELQAKGKASADQVAKAWAEVLKDEDLLTFRLRAQQSFDAGILSAKQMQQVIDAGLRESVRRAGLDMDAISGGMGKAAQNAVNDVDTMIGSLDRLKASGADVSLALSASIKKAIDTADSQKAIDTLEAQIKAVRKQLGDKVADGLLDQAAQKARELNDKVDQAKGGINSLREAMKELGLKSRDDLQSTADKAKQAFDTIIKAGQQEGESYLGWQARKRQAAEAMIQRMLDANNGLADTATKVAAASAGVKLEIDSMGNAAIQAAKHTKTAADSMVGDYHRVAGAAQHAAQATLGVNGSFSDQVKSQIGSTREQRLAGQGAFDMRPIMRMQELVEAGKLNTLGQDKVGEMEAVAKAIETNARMEAEVRKLNPAAFSLEHLSQVRAQEAVAAQLRQRIRALSAATSATGAEAVAPASASTEPGALAQPAMPAMPAATSTVTKVVRIEFPGGASADVPEDAAEVIIRQLEQAKFRSGR